MEGQSGSSPPRLNCYAQAEQGGEAYIVGTREALSALRAALDDALANSSGKAELQVSGGSKDTYSLRIRSVPDALMGRMWHPCAAISEAEGRSVRFGPSRIDEPGFVEKMEKDVREAEAFFNAPPSESGFW